MGNDVYNITELPSIKFLWSRAQKVLSEEIDFEIKASDRNEIETAITLPTINIFDPVESIW